MSEGTNGLANGQLAEQGGDIEMSGMSEEQRSQENHSTAQNLPPPETYLEPPSYPPQSSPPRSIPTDAADPVINGIMQPDTPEHIQPGPAPDTAPSIAVAPAPIDAQFEAAMSATVTTLPPTTTVPTEQQTPTHAATSTTTATQSPGPSTPTQHGVPGSTTGTGVATTLPPSHIIPPTNPQGSATRVYVNTKVTPWLLEGMKWVAANEPEKPLRWLSDFLDKKSREVEGA